MKNSEKGNDKKIIKVRPLTLNGKDTPRFNQSQENKEANGALLIMGRDRTDLRLEGESQKKNGIWRTSKNSGKKFPLRKKHGRGG